MSTLEDLRKINLAEQKAPSVSVDTEVRKPVSTDARKDVSTEGPTQASTPVREEASAPVRADKSTDVRTRARTQKARSQPPKLRTTPRAVPTDDLFLDRVREALARKTVHPGGVKATVDMAPDLSQRAKRYCLDHGNPPVRQVFLELMAAFLDAEGY